MGAAEDDVDRLYQEARTVRAEIEALWNEAQATDVAVKGAVSAALTDDLSESERDFAVSFGLQNAEKWHKLAELSQKLGGLIESIDRAKKKKRDLDRECPAVLAFLWASDVDATNWRAEHAIRPAVVNRKICGGNRCRPTQARRETARSGQTVTSTSAIRP